VMDSDAVRPLLGTNDENQILKEKPPV
jgi:hypothetical protein